MNIDYRAFIEDNFFIKNKLGEIVPFKFNETQNYYYDLMLGEYGETLQGVRENILKFRQPGFSSLIDAIFTTDFIYSEWGKIPIIDADIVSAREKDTQVLFNRVTQFLDSFFVKWGIDRKQFLEIDSNVQIKGRTGAQIFVQTASAKMIGRGGTKQNIHWSEVAFYPNTEILNANTLVVGAEQQVLDGVGKIFRETTGNTDVDFFAEEYFRGLEGQSEFKSRFLGWWLHPEYSKQPPVDWLMPPEYKKLHDKYGATVQQCYWHWFKISHAKDQDLMKREYPIDETEAFIGDGSQYFDNMLTKYYSEFTKEPIKTGVIYA
jgi:hypothetical protein